MNYIQMFDTFLVETADLSTDEAYNLFKQMLKYANADGAYEPEFIGAERYLWPSYKWRIDRAIAKYQKKCERAAKAREGKEAKRDDIPV